MEHQQRPALDEAKLFRKSATFQVLDPDDLARRLAAIKRHPKLSVLSQLKPARVISINDLLAPRQISKSLVTDQERCTSKLTAPQPDET